MKLTIVLPVFNEAGNLRSLTREIKEALNGICDYRVLFVNDGSTDNSRRILNEIAAAHERVEVIHFRKNAGQSAAFAAGFEEAGTPLVATMDADGQNDPNDLPDMLDEIGKYDVVAGYREDRKDNRVRQLASRFANKVRNLVTGEDIVDTGCSLKLFRREVLEDLPYFEGMHRFLPTLVRREGYNVVQVPTTHRPRIEGETKYSVMGRLLTTCLDLLAVRWLLDRTLDYEIDSKQ